MELKTPRIDAFFKDMEDFLRKFEDSFCSFIESINSDPEPIDLTTGNLLMLEEQLRAADNEHAMQSAMQSIVNSKESKKAVLLLSEENCPKKLLNEFSIDGVTDIFNAMLSMAYDEPPFQFDILPVADKKEAESKEAGIYFSITTNKSAKELKGLPAVIQKIISTLELFKDYLQDRKHWQLEPDAKGYSHNSIGSTLMLSVLKGMSEYFESSATLDVKICNYEDRLLNCVVVGESLCDGFGINGLYIPSKVRENNDLVKFLDKVPKKLEKNYTDQAREVEELYDQIIEMSADYPCTSTFSSFIHMRKLALPLLELGGMRENKESTLEKLIEMKRKLMNMQKSFSEIKLSTRHDQALRLYLRARFTLANNCLLSISADELQQATEEERVAIISNNHTKVSVDQMRMCQAVQSKLIELMVSLKKRDKLGHINRIWDTSSGVISKIWHKLEALRESIGSKSDWEDLFTIRINMLIATKNVLKSSSREIIFRYVLKDIEKLNIDILNHQAKKPVLGYLMDLEENVPKMLGEASQVLGAAILKYCKSIIDCEWFLLILNRAVCVLKKMINNDDINIDELEEYRQFFLDKFEKYPGQYPDLFKEQHEKMLAEIEVMIAERKESEIGYEEVFTGPC